MDGPPSRGEVWWTRFGSVGAALGHEQTKARPCLIVSADFVNESAAGMVIVIPLTTAHRPVRSHVPLVPPEGGIETESSIQCEQLRAVSNERLVRRIGRVEARTMRLVEYSLKMLLGLD